MSLKEAGRELLSEVPTDLAFDWDNVGWMTARLDEELKGVLVCVDASPEAMDAALEKGCNLVVSHHPLIFDSLNGLVDSDPHQASIMRAVRNSLGVLTLHTNADCCKGGLNDIYADYLGLEQPEPILPFEETESAGLGRVGKVSEPTSMAEVEASLKDRPEISYLRSVGDPAGEVDRLALCTGSGGDLLENQSVLTADLFVTGDLKHHDVETARLHGLDLIVLDHYEMEVVFLEFARGLLEEQLNFDVPVHYFERQTPYRHAVKPNLLDDREVPE